MTAITKSINGVVCVISPAVLKAGPNGQPVDFIGEGGGVSPMITIQFDVPVSQFSLTVVGLSKLPHITKAFNSSGNKVDEVVTQAPNAGFLSRVIGVGNALGVSQIVFPSFKEPVSSIQLIPPANEFVGYRDLNVTKSILAKEKDKTAEILTSQIILPEVKTIDLRDVIKVSKTGLARQYVKGSLKALPTETIVIENFSTDVEAQISLSGLAGITFDPAKFTLAAKESKKVVIGFNTTELEKLPTGINTIQVAVNFTSTAQLLEPVPPVEIKPVVVPPIKPPIIQPPVEIFPFPPKPESIPEVPIPSRITGPEVRPRLKDQFNNLNDREDKVEEEIDNNIVNNRTFEI